MRVTEPSDDELERDLAGMEAKIERDFAAGYVSDAAARGIRGIIKAAREGLASRKAGGVVAFGDIMKIFSDLHDAYGNRFFDKDGPSFQAAYDAADKLLGRWQRGELYSSDETAWLVEFKTSFWGVPTYYFIDDEDPDEMHTTNANKALRFARKIDAELFIEREGWTEAFASEHIWPAPRLPDDGETEG